MSGHRRARVRKRGARRLEEYLRRWQKQGADYGPVEAYYGELFLAWARVEPTDMLGAPIFIRRGNR